MSEEWTQTDLSESTHKVNFNCRRVHIEAMTAISQLGDESSLCAAGKGYEQITFGKLLSDGRTCGWIQTKDDCEEAAKLLGLSDTDATSVSNGFPVDGHPRPRGCSLFQPQLSKSNWLYRPNIVSLQS